MRRIPWVVLAWVGSLAVAPVVWWVLGDLSGPRAVERTWRAPAWLVDNTHLLGVAGVLAMVSVIAVEIVGLRLRFFARPLLFVYLPLVGAAALAAFNYRVMTALSSGSDVGWGLALLLGMPVAACLAVLHVFLLRDELRRERFITRRQLRRVRH